MLPDPLPDTRPDGPPSNPPPDGREDALRLAEALLFASDRPVTAARLALALGHAAPDLGELEAAAVLAALRERYRGRGVEVAQVAGGWCLRTAPDLAPALTRVVEVLKRLPRAAMEALSAIAWRQPVTRAEIEALRGAALGGHTLEALLEAGLIAPRGRREAPGRPVLWGTTPRFLEQFGLDSLAGLPRGEELLPDAGAGVTG